VERICTYSENTQDEVNLRTKFCCVYTENMQNESVSILRISRMNLFVYREHIEWIYTYAENMGNARKVKYLVKV
jgi:hypothetical protein